MAKWVKIDVVFQVAAIIWIAVWGGIYFGASLSAVVWSVACLALLATMIKWTRMWAVIVFWVAVIIGIALEMDNLEKLVNWLLPLLLGLLTIDFFIFAEEIKKSKWFKILAEKFKKSKWFKILAKEITGTIKRFSRMLLGLLKLWAKILLVVGSLALIINHRLSREFFRWMEWDFMLSLPKLTEILLLLGLPLLIIMSVKVFLLAFKAVDWFHWLRSLYNLFSSHSSPRVLLTDITAVACLSGVFMWQLFTTWITIPVSVKGLFEMGLLDSTEKAVIDMYQTPLHEAAYWNVVIMAKILLKKGADVNAKDWQGETALHEAAYWNAIDVAKVLIDESANVNAKDKNGETPLHEAASKNAVDVAKILLEKGVEVNTTDNIGETPLHEAAYRNASDMAKVLLEAGADVNAKGNIGETPLHKATYWNASDMAKILINEGANVNAKNDDGEMPLHKVVSENAVVMAKVLLEAGADVNAKDNIGETALHKATYWNASDMAKLQTLTTRAEEENNRFLLLIRDPHKKDTAKAKDNKWAQVLLEKGAEVNAKDNIGETPLHEAASVNAADVAKVLINEAADINAKDKNGKTPLHEAASVNAADVAKVLINEAADVNAKDNDGLTPLHSAAYLNAVNVAKVLLEKGAEVNAKDNDGLTPLHEAASENAVNVAKVLLEKGAEVNAKDNNDETPWNKAVMKGKFEMLQLLQRHGGPGKQD